MAKQVQRLDLKLFELPGGRDELRLVALRKVMDGYISPILVAGVFESSLKQARMSGRVEAEALVERCMIGLRLFVSAEELPNLMLDLAEQLESFR